MSVWRRLRESWRPTPDVADALIAVATFLVVLPPLMLGGRPGDQLRLELTAGAVGLLALGCVVLAFRRRAVWPVWSITTAVGLVACIEAQGPTPVFLPAVIALATVAARATSLRTLAATVVSSVVPAAVIVMISDRGLLESVASGMAPWTVVAALSGTALRTQRAVVVAALERATAAEARQEEEAQRRVAEERLRIARDLHDVVAHHIAVINVQSGVAQHLLRSSPEQAAEALAHVREASQTVLNEVPDLLGLLRTTEEAEPTAPTPTLERAGELVEHARRSGLDVTVHTTGVPVPLSVSADLAAYRVLQEALTNAARHGSGHAEVTLRHDPTGCAVTVTNPCTSSAAPGATPRRHGLVGMSERVTASGGTIMVGPRGDDWVVDVWLPADAVRQVG